MLFLTSKACSASKHARFVYVGRTTLVVVRVSPIAFALCRLNYCTAFLLALTLTSGSCCMLVRRALKSMHQFSLSKENFLIAWTCSISLTERALVPLGGVDDV